MKEHRLTLEVTVKSPFDADAVLIDLQDKLLELHDAYKFDIQFILGYLTREKE